MNKMQIAAARSARMRRFAFLPLLAFLPPQAGAPLHAQAPGANWVTERTERGTALARTVSGTPDVARLSLTCTAAGTPMVIGNFPTQRPGAHLSLILRAPNGQVGWLDTGWRQQPNSRLWTMQLSDGQFVDVLAGASAYVDVTFNGRANGRLSLAGSSRAIAEALAACWQPRSAAAAQGGVSGFTVDIALSPRAAAELRRRNEGITVWASYRGMPRRAYARHADDHTGELDLGQHEVTVPGRAGPVTVPETVLRRQRLSWITGAPEVLVNVYSARRSSQDNLLDCGIVSGDLPAIAGRSHRVLCRMIGEP